MLVLGSPSPRSCSPRTPINTWAELAHLFATARDSDGNAPHEQPLPSIFQHLYPLHEPPEEAQKQEAKSSAQYKEMLKERLCGEGFRRLWACTPKLGLEREGKQAGSAQGLSAPPGSNGTTAQSL